MEPEYPMSKRHSDPAKRAPAVIFPVLSSIGFTVSSTAPLSKAKKNGPPYGRVPLRSSSLAFKYTLHCGVRYADSAMPCLLRSVPSQVTGAAAETAATCAGVLPAGTKPPASGGLLDPGPLRMDFASVDKRFGMSRTKASTLNEPALPYTA